MERLITEPSGARLEDVLLLPDDEFKKAINELGTMLKQWDIHMLDAPFRDLAKE